MVVGLLIPEVPVATAKAQLPEVLDRARHHLLQVVTRNGRDPVALVALGDLRELLHEHRFDTEVAVHTGEATVSLPQFSIIGIGGTIDAAVEDALDKLRAYAIQYLERLDFYRHTNRRNQYPLVMRFLLTPEAEQGDLLQQPTEADAIPA